MRILRYSITLLFFFIFSQSSYAERVTVEFTATIDQLNDSYNVTSGQFSVGTTISGTYTFDSDIPLVYNDDTSRFTEYRLDSPFDQALGYTLQVGDLSYVPGTDPNNALSVFVSDDMLPWDGSQGLWDVTSLVQFSPGNIGEYEIMHIGIDLIDPTASVLTSRNLSDVLSSINDFSDRQLVLAGQDTFFYSWFDIQATITSFTVNGVSLTDDPVACGTNLDKSKMAFEAIVSYIDDSSGGFGTSLNKGDLITGNYTMNPAMPFTDLNPTTRRYEAASDDTTSGFTLNAFNEVIDTRGQGEFSITIDNMESGTGSDAYAVISRFMNVPLPSGIRIHNVIIETFEHNGTALDSNDINIASLAPVNNWSAIKLYINGFHPNGEFFTVGAKVTALAPGEDAVIDLLTAPAKLMPESGVVYGNEMFSGTIVMPAGSPRVIDQSGMIYNKEGFGGFPCWFNNMAMNGQQVIRCEDMSRFLREGNNAIEVQLRLDDGRTIKFINRYVKIN